MVRWSTVVPPRVIASGVVSEAPAAISRAAMSETLSAPFRNTTVTRGWDSSSQGKSVSAASTTRN